MEEKKIYTYAFYNIDGKDFYQYLPTSNLSDVIYVKGMKSVKEKRFIKDNNHYIEIDSPNEIVGVGEVIYSSDIIRRYYEHDPLFQNYTSSIIEWLKTIPDADFTLYGDGNVAPIDHYETYISVNSGVISISEEPHNIIKGENHWYLELYHENSSITYEKTLFDDGKYRGQPCNSYALVKVIEYKLNGNNRQVIIERDRNIYPYKIVTQSVLDDIIDKAKGFISHKIKFNGFKDVSPLYSFNTEDSACVFHDNQDKIKDNTVTTVTGSGDAILDLFLYGAKKVIAFDTNVLTIFYAELKFIAAKYLPFETFEIYFSNFKEEIYNQLRPYLSNNTRKFWDEMYSYIKLVNKKIRDYENGGLFYPEPPVFSANSTVYNKKGYYTKENYLKLQQILKDKSLKDISFINYDLFELPNKVDLSDSSYVYLSNIMDFLVGVDKYNIDDKKLEEFKCFILDKLLPALKGNADIELSYIKKSWHQEIEKNYLDIYTTNEGFEIYLLSNNRDSVLSFRSHLLLENNRKPKKF